MSELTDLQITQALDLLEKKEISSLELTQEYIRKIEKTDSVLNAYITKTLETAEEQAKESDIKRSKGECGDLEGIPIAHKDVFCTKGVLTTAASQMLSSFVPPYESTVSQKLKDAGTIMLGKLNTDQFAMGVSTITSYYGLTKNPWADADGNYTLVSGGSSGGPAAAVASGMCMAATGTDTGGSSRQPASFCGIVGLKPTYGRCSRWGIVAYASSLDQAGVLARSVEDTALMLKNMAGYDPKDSTSAQKNVPDYRAFLKDGIKGKKIGIPQEYKIEGLNPEIEKIWEKGIQILKDAGAEIVNVSLPHTQYALPVYYIISPAEASSNLARYDGIRYTLREEGASLDELYTLTRSKFFGDEVKRRIFLGTFVLSAGFYDAYYTRAQKVRRLIYNDFINAYQKVDALLVPTAPTTAISEKEMRSMSALDAYLADVFTTPSSLAGVPSVSVPVALASNGLPVGLQVMGRHFDETTILQIAYALEKGAGMSLKPHYVKGK